MTSGNAAPRLPIDPVGGYFGADSVAWRVLSTPAAALMIAQITNLLEVPHLDFQNVLVDHDPLFPTNGKCQRGHRTSAKSGHFHDRLRRTVGVPLPIVFGSQRDAISCADRLLAYHQPMHGIGADGVTPYSATDPDAMLFAAVTITHAGLIAYEKFGFTGNALPHRLPPDDRDRYFAEMTQLAALMGVPDGDIPVTAQEVGEYYRSIADKFTTRPGWRAAQVATATALLRPAGLADLKATAADAALTISALFAFTALPKPSRRLHGIPAAADPILAVIYAAALPFFGLLRIGPLRRAAMVWFLGRDDADVLENAQSLIQECP